MRKRKAARSVSSRRSDKAWRCKNAVSDSWLRASSVAWAFSSSLLLLLRAGASPPHSLSSGENSTLPSPSQLSATPVASNGASDASLAVSTRTSLTRSMGPSQLSLSGSDSVGAATAFSCARPKSSRAAKSSISFSRNGLSSSICSISWLNSSVDSCNRRIDCCSCGVSARCCETRSERPCFMLRARLYIRKFSPRYTRRTSGFWTMSCGLPSASTRPSLMMAAWSQIPRVSRTLWSVINTPMPLDFRKPMMR